MDRWSWSACFQDLECEQKSFCFLLINHEQNGCSPVTKVRRGLELPGAWSYVPIHNGPKPSVAATGPPPILHPYHIFSAVDAILLAITERIEAVRVSYFSYTTSAAQHPPPPLLVLLALANTFSKLSFQRMLRASIGTFLNLLMLCLFFGCHGRKPIVLNHIIDFHLAKPIASHR